MQLQLSALFSLLTAALFAVPAPNVIPDRCIINIPSQFGFSVWFQNLPLGSVGDGFFGNSCATQHAFEVSQGASCWNSRSNRRVGAVSWKRFRRSAGDLLEDEQTKGLAPSLFTYDDHTGVQNTIVVPADDEDAAQKIADLYEAKDFEALAFAVK